MSFFEKTGSAASPDIDLLFWVPGGLWQTPPYSPEFEPDIVLIEPQPRHYTPSAWMMLCTLGGSITLYSVAA
jgi:hypothetical protein